MDAIESPSQSLQRTPLRAPTAAPGACRAFSITELLVVIGIIVLLAGLLVVAMGKVRESSLRTSTLATMQNFARACDAFQTEHGFYPGVIPEQTLAAAIMNNEISVAKSTGGNGKTFSSTENALLHLMGGYRVLSPHAKAGTPEHDQYEVFAKTATHLLTIGAGDSKWQLAVNVNRMGQGPFINGKPYAPYYTPGPHEVRAAPGQVAADGDIGNDPGLPDLIDAWGTPILYTRRIRSSGPLVGNPNETNTGLMPQFAIDGMRSYLESKALGERGFDQTDSTIGSMFYGDNPGAVRERFAQVIRQPAFGLWNKSPLDDDNRGRVAPRGEYVLISAGQNGVYFSRADGPGSRRTPIPSDGTDIVPPGNNANAKAVASFSDIVIFGGG